MERIQRRLPGRKEPPQVYGIWEELQVKIQRRRSEHWMEQVSAEQEGRVAIEY